MQDFGANDTNQKVKKPPWNGEKKTPDPISSERLTRIYEKLTANNKKPYLSFFKDFFYFYLFVYERQRESET